jgi:hypothetical protein
MTCAQLLMPGLPDTFADKLASVDRLIAEARARENDPHRATDGGFRAAQRAEVARLLCVRRSVVRDQQGGLL